LGERYLMTTDGLYIGSVFRDCRSAPDTLPDEPRRGMSVNSATAGGEPFGGDFFKNPIDGNFYIVGPVSGGRECAIVTRVVGLDTVRLLPSQKIVFTKEDYAKAEEMLKEKAGKQSFQNTLRIARMKKKIEGIPNYDDFDWSDPRVASWRFDPLHYARATWSYDEENLYLCFRDIRDDTPMINNGNDPRTLFKTGDALEFELRTTPNDDSKEIIPGDLRLLISVFQGNPIAVLYRYRVPGTEKPVEFASPVTTTKIDEVRILEDAKISIDRWGESYGVRVVVPLKELGFKPEPGKTYRGDFGVVYSDKSGRINELEDVLVQSRFGVGERPRLGGEYISQRLGLLHSGGIRDEEALCSLVLLSISLSRRAVAGICLSHDKGRGEGEGFPILSDQYGWNGRRIWEGRPSLCPFRCLILG
jgi:hypothetical protein